MTLKWSGDFTLPRLRAKLASKYNLHPGLEPEYAEVYKPELSKTSVMRRDFGSTGNLRDYVEQFESTQPALNGTQTLGTFGSTGMLTQTLGRNQSATLKGDFTNFMDAAGSRRLNGSSSGSSFKELPYSMRPPRRVASVPSLGLRRNDRAPASLQPLPPNLRAPGAPLASSQRQLRIDKPERPATPTSPTSPKEELDPRQIEKEKMAEMASRRFWNAAHGNMHFLQEELEQLKRENPGMTNDQIAAKLKSTQACRQMNEERKKGAKVDWQNKDWDGATLLIRAVRTDAQALMLHLIGLGADPQFVDNSGRGVLHWAAIEGNGEIMEFFLTSPTYVEMNFRAPDNGGDTPLHLAAYHGHLPVVRMLVQNGSDISAVSEKGFTPYQLAESRHMWHVTNYIEEHRQQEEDKANKEEMSLMDLLRPCDMARAEEYRLELADE